MALDDELKSLGRAVLKNAFYHDLNYMVARYRQAAEGLDMRIEELAEVHAFGDGVEGPESDFFLNLYVDWPSPGIFGPDSRASCGCATLAEAFEIEEAEHIVVQGRVVFERRGGEWHYVNN